jgi:dihydrolipoamide dehydrogenase
MSANEYDLVVLGGGTGGYVAAIRASQLGMKVALVEKDKVGGTCLHRGCIPSKSLLRSAEIYYTLTESESYGFEVEQVKINFQKIQARKQRIVDQLYQGVIHLLTKGKITVFAGEGRIMGPSIFSPQAGAVAVTQENGESEILVPKFLLIATGAHPRIIQGIKVDGQYVMTSNEALAMEQLPRSVIIVGGGMIGIEWASLLNDLGVEVQIVELAERILPLEDRAISKEMTRLLKKRKVKILTSAKIQPETFSIEGQTVCVKVEQNGELKEIRADRLLLSVGRAANVENIGLENTEVKASNGVIETNDVYQTAESHIYAVGDVIGGLQLAHVASREGTIAVDHMAGLQPLPLNYSHVPKVTYSRPEVASVGLTEQEAVEQGFAIKTGIFHFRAIGKALIHGSTDGFVKLIMDEAQQDILGVHMIGSNVSELIAEGALASVLDATPWEIAHTIHPHPSLSEIIGEAALAIEGKAIHS